MARRGSIPSGVVRWLSRRSSLRQARSRSGLALTLLTTLTVPLHAQRPSELEGRVIAAEDGAPVTGALLELVQTGATTVTDAAGAYRFRLAASGRYTLRVSRTGYGERIVEVTLDGARSVQVDVTLDRVYALPRLDVRGYSRAAGAQRVDRSVIARSSVRTAGDIAALLPGVVVQSNAPGGAQTVSVRGAEPAALLVLVDGVPLNDPVTGEADLSTLPASTVESLTLLPGARSARYGPRAEAGVMLVQTRPESADRSLTTSVGSLGDHGVTAGWGGVAPLAWSAGVEWRTLAGGFTYRQPAEVGGGTARRSNADLQSTAAHAAAALPLAGGPLRIRVHAERLDRGLAGKSYAPSLHAREELARAAGSASWRRDGPTGSLGIVAAASSQQVSFRDPQPPLGPGYDDTTAVQTFDLRATGERTHVGVRGAGMGGGLDLRWQGVHASTLMDADMRGRWDAGGFLHAQLERTLGSTSILLAGEWRAQRDPLDHHWVPAHALTLSIGGRRLRAHVARRSSYSPPTLADQFFRAGVGVEPNPDLRAERVPAEVEVGVQGAGRWGPVEAHATVTAYRGDVRGMIVWAPDFRFIWSPRNVDVKRRGVEASLNLGTLDDRLGLSLSHAYNRVTYDRAPGDDDVQVLYRPRHTTRLQLRWQATRNRLELDADYTGARNTAPSAVNALPGFWELDGRLARDWSLGAMHLSTTLAVDRILDQRASLIYGFPEPGRRFRVGIRLTLPPPGEREKAREKEKGGRGG